MLTKQNKKVIDAYRDHLVHVTHDLQVGGILNMIVEIVQELKTYRHTLLHETPPDQWNAEALWYAQVNGLEVVQTDRITQFDLDCGGYTGAILYALQDRPDVGTVLPSVYYAYGVYDPGVKADIVLPCSEYAATTDRAGKPLASPLDKDWVLPPLVNTRPLRRLVAPAHDYTIGILTSGNFGKYPCELVMDMLTLLPDVKVRLTVLPTKYRDFGMPMALQNEQQRRPPRIGFCPVRPTGGVQYTVGVDTLVYGSAADFYEPYGRTVVEAMALGKAVVCERKGVFGTRLEHGVNALLYDTSQEAADYVMRLGKDTILRERLGANAQMWASWDDVSVHIGKLKRTLRMVGT